MGSKRLESGLQVTGRSISPLARAVGVPLERMRDSQKELLEALQTESPFEPLHCWNT